MDTLRLVFKSIVVNLLGTAAAFAAILFAIWYFWGMTTVVATVDGKEVEGAEVLINDLSVGHTPFERRLGYGHHKVTVKPPENYAVQELQYDKRFFTLLRGDAFTARFKSAHHVKTTIRCSLEGRELSGCEVEVDGNLVGTAPLWIELEPGKHEIVVVPPIEPYTNETEWIAERELTAPTTVDASFTRLRQ